MQYRPSPTILFLACLLLGIGAAAWYGLHRHPSNPPLPSSSTPLSVLIMGDSLAAGVGASDQAHQLAPQLKLALQSRYPHVQVSTLGVSGAKALDVVAAQLPLVSNAHPDVVILIVGGNDIIQETSTESFSQDMHTLISQLGTSTHPLVMVNIGKLGATLVIPSGLEHLANYRTKQFNAVITNEVSKNPYTTVADFYSLSSEQLASHQPVLSDDAFHPNDLGYQRLAELIAASVRVAP